MAVDDGAALGGCTDIVHRRLRRVQRSLLLGADERGLLAIYCVLSCCSSARALLLLHGFHNFKESLRFLVFIYVGVEAVCETSQFPVVIPRVHLA